MRSLPPLLLLVAACGSLATAPPPSGPVGSAAPPELAPRVATPCPEDPAAIIEPLWEIPDNGGYEHDCLALRDGDDTLWLLVGEVNPDDGERSRHASLVTSAGTARWNASGEALGSLLEHHTVQWGAADLDGDGRDEVVRTIQLDEDERVEVYVLAGQALDFADGDDLVLRWFGGGEVCDRARWEVVAGDGAAQDLEVTRTGSACDPPGTTRYRWDGTSLVPR